MRRAIAVPLLLALPAGLAADPPKPPAKDRLDVSSARRPDTRGRITSQKSVGGKPVLHGLQVVLGPRNWMKETAVYNEGVLESREQFYPNGETFRAQRREHDGSGTEVLYPAEPNRVIADNLKVDGGTIRVETRDPVATGLVKGDRRWGGTFLERDYEGFAFKLVLREYRDGKAVKSGPFPVEKLGLPKGHTDPDTWLWEFPDWPAK